MEPRQRKEATSIAGRAINWLTDKLGITEAPTYTDGYGVERRSEIPFWEGTQGKKLKKIGETALDFTPIVGDVKGLTIDPYRAYKEGGWGAGQIKSYYGITDGSKTFSRKELIEMIDNYLKDSNTIDNGISDMRARIQRGRESLFTDWVNKNVLSFSPLIILPTTIKNNDNE